MKGSPFEDRKKPLKSLLKKSVGGLTSDANFEREREREREGVLKVLNAPMKSRFSKCVLKVPSLTGLSHAQHGPFGDHSDQSNLVQVSSSISNLDSRHTIIRSASLPAFLQPLKMTITWKQGNNLISKPLHNCGGWLQSSSTFSCILSLRYSVPHLQCASVCTF